MDRYMLLLMTITPIFLRVAAQNLSFDSDNIRNVFLNKLLDKITNGTSLTEEKLEQYFVKHSIYKNENTNITRCIVQHENGSVKLEEDCLLNSCLSPADVLELSGLVDSQTVSATELSTLSALLIHQYENSSCMEHVEETKTQHHTHRAVSSAEAWGYGILFVTAINLCSLGGLVVLPFIHHSIYKKILIYMIALAVGTLCGSSLLFLIPEALELAGDEINAESFIWKSMTIIVGIYTFFNIERILKMIMDYRQKRYGKVDKHKSEDPAADFSTFHDVPPVPNAEYKDVDKLPYTTPCGDNNQKGSATSSSLSLSSADLHDNEAEKLQQNELTNGLLQNGLTQNVLSQNGLIIKKGHEKHSKHHHHHVQYHEDKPVAPVAWMIIFGDGLHNFIDGVSIGAAFTESILAGISVSLAIFCEELPHELGDFAVLLNAGMKLKRAVMFNFLSACMCYVGMTVGIFLGENTAAHDWVFAFAGGMFLYISLVDMMPEMNSTGESEENKKQIGEKFIFFLQNMGLLTGFGIMLLMAVYGGNINLES